MAESKEAKKKGELKKTNTRVAGADRGENPLPVLRPITAPCHPKENLICSMGHGSKSPQQATATQSPGWRPRFLHNSGASLACFKAELLFFLSNVVF